MKRRVKPKYQPEKQWLQMLTAFVVVIAVIIGALGYWRITENNRRVEQAQIALEQNQRQRRIEAIFDSFKLDASFKATSVNIFGEKRIYPWDSGRTYASYIEYMRFEPVDETARLARKAIERAGFELIEEPNPGSADTQYHFKNADDEFVRLTVTSRAVNDAIMTGQPPKDADTNAAPSIVLIKVNLDDNNE